MYRQNLRYSLFMIYQVHLSFNSNSTNILFYSISDTLMYKTQFMLNITLNSIVFGFRETTYPTKRILLSFLRLISQCGHFIWKWSPSFKLTVPNSICPTFRLLFEHHFNILITIKNDFIHSLNHHYGRDKWPAINSVVYTFLSVKLFLYFVLLLLCGIIEGIGHRIIRRKKASDSGEISE